jgi:thymidylate synthase (FAD)
MTDIAEDSSRAHNSAYRGSVCQGKATYLWHKVSAPALLIAQPPTPRTMPTTFLIGTTRLISLGLMDYLKETGQTKFLSEVAKAQNAGLSDLEILSSFYAKLCYSALTPDKNENISRVRGIADNVRGTLDSGHGSVFEHVSLNFVTTDCSRVFTHEMVRHRAGTAYSQTSGRYVRTQELRIVSDPILAPVQYASDALIKHIQEQYDYMRLMMGACSQEELDDARKTWHSSSPPLPDAPIKDFATKKKVTSALRRHLPNGQTNELGWSANIRSLRHMLMMRTNRQAEWEIRLIFNQVYDLLMARCPGLLFDAVTEEVDGLLEITGMKTQPY